jgi:hypothetical protein
MQSKSRKFPGAIMAAVLLVAACAFAPVSLASTSAPPEAAITAAQEYESTVQQSTVSPVLAQWLALGACAAVGVFLVERFTRKLPIGRRLVAVNTLPANVGSTVRSRRFKAAAAMATRYVFVKAGADDEHVAAIAAASDKPIGVITDEAAAAEDPINVELPCTERTLPMPAKVAINTLNSDLYMSADGKVGLKPTAAGTYWKVGRNLTLATAENDPVEVELCEPRKLIVIAALGNAADEIGDLTFTAAGPTAAECEALRDKCEELAGDMRAIAGALNGDADVALATS